MKDGDIVCFHTVTAGISTFLANVVSCVSWQGVVGKVCFTQSVTASDTWTLVSKGMVISQVEVWMTFLVTLAFP